jgi:iron complex outermembrane receptor protein
VNELFSNGVHHGTASFERGDPNLVPERALNTSISVHYDHKIFEIEATAFQNAIDNFIYLKPEITPVLTIRGAFPAFSYAQTDAILRGGDFTLSLHPVKNTVLRVKGTTLFAHDKTANDWLPLMPADKLETSLGIDNQNFKYAKKTYALLSLSLVKKQNRIPLSITDLQNPPSGYGLLGVTVGSNLKIGRQTIETIFKIDNILNQSYRDYLDRMRYFADAPGRNISLKLKTRF